MAIGPTVLTEKFQKDLDRFEQLIDEQLTAKKLNGGRVIVAVPTSMNDDHFKHLKKRYIAAGWSDVKLETDFREGDSWMTFIS